MALVPSSDVANGDPGPASLCSDPSVMVSENAPVKTRQFWALHGHIHSERYSDPSLNSIATLVKYDAIVFKKQVAFMCPASSKSDTKYIPITWHRFHHITEVLARDYGKLLRREVANGQNSGCQPTIALLGSGTTFEYFATQIALQKLNLRTLLLADESPENVLKHLLFECHAVAIICDSKNSNIAINHLRKISMIENPLQLHKTLAEGELDSIRFEDRSDPWKRHAFILHSSGSTGMPKAIIHTNRSMMLIARSYRLFPDFHIENWYLMFPLYHIAGISIMLSSLPNGLTTSMPPLLWPPPASYILKAWETLESQGHPVDCFHCPPTIIESVFEQITKTGSDFSPLSSLKVLQPGGAKLADSVVSNLSSHGVNVKTTYGSTEIGPVMRSIPHTKDNPKCYSLRISDPETEKIEMLNCGGGLYELVIHKGFGLAAELWNDKNSEPYHTNDLFREDPPVSGNFVLQGRRDDVLVHSNGNNTSAGALQLDIQAANPIIKNVLAVGHARPCVALLVELKPDSGVEHDEAHEILWIGLQKVNKNHPSYSQVLSSMVFLLPSGKTLPVTPKGNVRRNETIAIYKEAIDTMYQELKGEDISNDDSQSHDRDSIPSLVRSCVTAAFKVPQASLKDTTSFYQIGMDSLSALQMRSDLSKKVGNITIGTIFENPSVAQLITYFQGSTSSTTENKHISFINKAIARYTAEFSSWPHSPPTTVGHSTNGTVLLTGASGSLGSAILEAMLAASEVTKLYVLVRRQGGLSKLRASLELRNMDVSILESRKLEILNYSMQDPLLGLDIEFYHQLSKEVTTVIHCAWKVNFYQTVEAFEDDCLKGTMALLRFCCAGMRKVFAFTSSVSTCMGRGFRSREVPEEPIGDDPAVALGTGYAQSKFIAERTIQAASRELTMKCVLLRIGQLSGHTRCGQWSEQEMYPIMFATAFRLMALPTIENRLVDWLPVDIAATTITDVLIRDNRQENGYCALFNVVHPHPVPWSRLLELLQECQVNSGKPRLAEIPILEWTKRLAETENSFSGDAKGLPGLKVLQFFEEMALEIDQSTTFSTTKVEEISETLRSCPPLAYDWVEAYVKQWRQSGFLPD